MSSCHVVLLQTLASADSLRQAAQAWQHQAALTPSRFNAQHKTPCAAPSSLHGAGFSPGVNPSSLLMWMVAVSRAQAANGVRFGLSCGTAHKTRQCFVHCCQHGAIAGAGAFCHPPPTPCSTARNTRTFQSTGPTCPGHPPHQVPSPGYQASTTSLPSSPGRLDTTLPHRYPSVLGGRRSSLLCTRLGRMRPPHSALGRQPRPAALGPPAPACCFSQTPSYGSVWPLSRFCLVGGAGTARGSCRQLSSKTLPLPGAIRNCPRGMMPSLDWPNRASARRLTSNGVQRLFCCWTCGGAAWPPAGRNPSPCPFCKASVGVPCASCNCILHSRTQCRWNYGAHPAFLRPDAAPLCPDCWLMWARSLQACPLRRRPPPLADDLLQKLARCRPLPSRSWLPGSSLLRAAA